MNITKNNAEALKALSTARQAHLRSLWDKNLVNPVAFIPREQIMKGISRARAQEENVRFGATAADYFKRILANLTGSSDVERRLLHRRKVLAVGYGRGYDSKWLREATEAGFQTWWVDISSMIWLWITKDLMDQSEAMGHSGVVEKPQVKIAEIQSLLADPKMVELDLASVEIWYLCRLLNCISTHSAKIVLQEIGRATLSEGSNPDKCNAVIIINALRDENPTLQGSTSIIRSRRMILSNLRLGANRPLEVRWVEGYTYFTQKYTAMTIMASA